VHIKGIHNLKLYKGCWFCNDKLCFNYRKIE